ncbi:hypothetical protein Ciccas_013408 [Cichlidogyrus casuarinus]|uniref:Peptidase M13 C-terminal domain-containing protein n=1 Tax=Cichlidogyrus casuarinus TaxID=1844966 RepID=A0ABD2PLS4_9PLAT
MSWQQIFFTAYAQNLCNKVSDLNHLRELNMYSHPLPVFRLYSVMSNSEEFAKAFNCPAGSPMNPTVKCHL